MSSYFIPAQKICPTHLPPCTPIVTAFTSRPAIRRRSATVSHITAWAAQIQPGSPAPLSPRSPKSPFRRPSVSSFNKPSFRSHRRTSSNFLNLVDTPTTGKSYNVLPTPSFSEFKAIGPTLAQHGYASVIVQLPTVSHTTSVKDLAHKPSPFSIPIPPIPKTSTANGFKRLRSLSFGMNFSSKKSTTSAPASSAHRSKKSAGSTGLSRYGHVKPLNLGAEVQLSQLLDGGSQEANVKRVMHDAARHHGSSGVGTAFRTTNGELWWDEDERWEVEDLLGRPQMPAKKSKKVKTPIPEPLTTDGWIAFSRDSVVENEERRGSVSTISSPDSDLDPRYVVHAAESIDPARISSKAARTRMMQPQAHLTKVASELHAFKLGAQDSDYTNASCAKDRPKGAARRRPAPLSLAPQVTNQPVPVVVKTAMVAKRDFLENSFVPPVPVRTTALPPRSSSTTPHASSRPSADHHSTFSPSHSRFASSAMANITRQRTSGSTATVTPSTVGNLRAGMSSTTSLSQASKKKDIKSMFKFGSRK